MMWYEQLGLIVFVGGLVVAIVWWCARAVISGLDAESRYTCPTCRSEKLRPVNCSLYGATLVCENGHESEWDVGPY